MVIITYLEKPLKLGDNSISVSNQVVQDDYSKYAQTSVAAGNPCVKKAGNPGKVIRVKPFVDLPDIHKGRLNVQTNFRSIRREFCKLPSDTVKCVFALIQMKKASWARHAYSSYRMLVRLSHWTNLHQIWKDGSLGWLEQQFNFIPMNPFPPSYMYPWFHLSSVTGFDSYSFLPNFCHLFLDFCLLLPTKLLYFGEMCALQLKIRDNPENDFFELHSTLSWVRKSERRTAIPRIFEIIFRYSYHNYQPISF